MQHVNFDAAGGARLHSRLLFLRAEILRTPPGPHQSFGMQKASVMKVPNLVALKTWQSFKASISPSDMKNLLTS